eukprot:1278079-Rhodomonas_salina.1
MVSRRCAMVMIVRSVKFSRRIFCTLASVSESSAAVASSSSSSFDGVSMARARQSSCCWPSE